MEHAKKYALIPEESLSKHVPTQKHMTAFDKEMARILNSSLGEDEKVKLYYELLQKKLKMNFFNTPVQAAIRKEDMEEEEKVFIKKEQPEKKPTIKEFSSNYDGILLNSVPVKLKRYAGEMISLIRRHPDILDWNESGQILYHRAVIPKSNIVDLFNLIFTNRKSHVAAKDSFLSALDEMNIPRHYVKNTHLYDQQPKRTPPKSRKTLNWWNFK